MTLRTPLWMQAASGDTAPQYAGIDDRGAFSHLVVSEGVTRLTGLKVTQRGAGANFSVDVSAGSVVVQGDDAADQGSYLCVSTATENRAIPLPPGTGTRIHRVVARVRDRLYNNTLPSGTYDWVLEVLEDTGGGTPSEPNSAVTLALVTVAAGQISVQEDHINRRRLNAQGLPGRPFQVGADVDRPENPLASEMWWRTDKKLHELWNGTEYAELLNNKTGPQWGTWTPALTATTVNPTLGTGSAAAGYYTRVGRTINATAFIRAGTSGVAAGTGNYRISLPVTARDISPVFFQGAASAFDSSGSDVLSGTVRCGSVSGWGAVEIYLDSTTWSSTGPFVLAASDSVGFSLTYEAAS